MIMIKFPAAYFDILTAVATSILTVLVLEKTERYVPIVVDKVT
jgi:hypothetical protein